MTQHTRLPSTPPALDGVDLRSIAPRVARARTASVFQGHHHALAAATFTRRAVRSAGGVRRINTQKKRPCAML